MYKYAIVYGEEPEDYIPLQLYTTVNKAITAIQNSLQAYKLTPKYSFKYELRTYRIDCVDVKPLPAIPQGDRGQPRVT